MPTIKIELREGKKKETLIDIKQCVMDSVVEVLQLSDNDRSIRLIEYKEGYFEMKPPYEILIEISMFTGRTKETKKRLYQKIVSSLDSNKLIKKDRVLITLNEQPMENWAGRGGISADEMNLEFRIKI